MQPTWATETSKLKTDFYVQIMGLGDLTKLNILPGDQGGELDPHGAYGTGNPEGGNVTTNAIDGTDMNIEEWMLFISATEFCLSACVASNGTYSAGAMCEHKLDVMGCQFVMPATYQPAGVFETCDADVAYPPGWYPKADGSFSKFAQYFTGVYNGGDGKPTSYTVGDTTTPNAPASTPRSSNCVTVATIANQGVVVTGGSGPSATPVSKSSGAAGASATPGSKSAGAPGSSSKPTSGAGASGGSQTQTGSGGPPSGSSAAFRTAHVASTGTEFVGILLVSLVAGLAAVGLLN